MTSGSRGWAGEGRPPEHPAHLTRLRVRYGETDRMGVVYHANYIVYFEVGRTELIRSLGATYAALEEGGLRLVVTETGMRLRAPARYDDELRIETRITAVERVRLRFDYRVLLEGEERLIATGHTVLASVDEAGRPRRLDGALRSALAAFLDPRGPSDA